MLPKKLAMTLMVLSVVCPAFAVTYNATISTTPSPAISTKALEVTIQTQNLGSEVYCYTWCESVNGSQKTPFSWEGANNEKFRMGGSGWFAGSGGGYGCDSDGCAFHPSWH